ncbi:DUF2325 domain-containing protein [Bacillus swezeyi]|uniref:DUF2325 domain-containing protein n=1 Tax=Bacillus swezeyi TaxID=1925020 RepID=A0A5M8REC0_9BACI|nr:DUF2325 domain-containing protein [Bacillus swezeyi]KAA6446947.1 DUF2325 domain-containing protein [Bacillus swezeyi]KAA6471515.1 DUF2325 domain-containing protein [Bacillus swezeyi]
MKITIIGGTQEKTFKKIGQKNGCVVLFHNGKTRNGAIKADLRTYIKKADCVCVMLSACGHGTMETVRALCNEYDIPCVFHNSRGASGAIKLCKEKIKTAAAVAA